MMNKFMISRIYLNNFKSIDEAIVQFDGENLNVLDGPNGFGKTTIYDAIQLLLTGSVRRIESNKIVLGNQGFDDHLFSKNQSLPTEIVVEFTNKLDDSNLVLQRKLLPPIDMNKSDKKPQNFSKYNLYKLKSFDDRTSNQKLDESQLDEIFGMKDMIEKFNLYQYIEQEESTYLFKKTEKDRMELISKLFNIEEETTQKQFFEKVRNKLQSYRTSLNNDYENLNKELRKNDFNSKDIHDFDLSLTNKYKPLINFEKIINIPWDKEEIFPLDLKLKEKYMFEIDILNLLITYKDDFKNELNNEQRDQLIRSEKKLEALIILGHFQDEIDYLINRFNNQEKFKSILSTLIEKEFTQKNIDWNFVFNNLEIPFEKKYVDQNVELIKSYKESENNLSSLISDMIRTRENLELQFKSYNKLNSNGDIECPLCGDSKNSFEELTFQINEKTDSLKKSLDSNSQKYEKNLNNFFTKYIVIVIKKIEEWLNKNKIDSKFFNQLISYSHVSIDMEKAKEWFSKEKILVEKYINNKEEYIDNIDGIVNIIQLEIKKRKISVSEVCKENMSQFKNMFSNRLDSDWNLLSQITHEAIKEKKNYVDFQYFVKTSESYEESEKLKVKLHEIDKKIVIINNLVKKYNTKINSHRSKMIRDIEIPFYIYCGKIIQNHQRGMGVFIKEEKEKLVTGETEIKSLRFIPPVDTDHDIVHSFSSGQLSSTVIAFTLALNKVYGNTGIMTLLIDDPIQTMDEMNMASFVELLRNDFNDRQLVISTHEDNISLYLRYKFLKYGLSVGNINVKRNLYSK